MAAGRACSPNLLVTCIFLSTKALSLSGGETLLVFLPMAKYFQPTYNLIQKGLKCKLLHELKIQEI
jgi:hypothetical protein